MTTTPSQDREAFEAWAKTNRMRYPEEALDFTEGVCNDYPHSRWLQMDWEVWQARAELAATAAPEQPKPVAWMDEFGNVFPLTAWRHPERASHHDIYKKLWKPLYLAAPQPEQTADLHGAVMNIPSESEARICGLDTAGLYAYKLGHRDARHAAAELVAQKSNAHDRRELPALSDEMLMSLCALHGASKSVVRAVYQDLLAAGGKP